MTACNLLSFWEARPPKDAPDSCEVPREREELQLLQPPSSPPRVSSTCQLGQSDMAPARASGARVVSGKRQAELSRESKNKRTHARERGEGQRREGERTGRATTGPTTLGDPPVVQLRQIDPSRVTVINPTRFVTSLFLTNPVLQANLP